MCIDGSFSDEAKDNVHWALIFSCFSVLNCSRAVMRLQCNVLVKTSSSSLKPFPSPSTHAVCKYQRIIILFAPKLHMDAIGASYQHRLNSSSFGSPSQKHPGASVPSVSGWQWKEVWGEVAERWLQDIPVFVSCLFCHQLCQEFDKPNAHLSCSS